MKPSRRIALRCDLSEKEIIVGEQVLLTVGVGSFPGTISYVFVYKEVKHRIGIKASGRAFSNLVIGEDCMARGRLVVS